MQKIPRLTTTVRIGVMAGRIPVDKGTIRTITPTELMGIATVTSARTTITICGSSIGTDESSLIPFLRHLNRNQRE